MIEVTLHMHSCFRTWHLPNGAWD